MKKEFFFILAFAIHFQHFAQPVDGNATGLPAKSETSLERQKGNLVLYWGYNKGYFSKSNIHFSGPDYDFTLFDVTANDRPASFSFNGYFNPERMWVPQYNYRAGYFFTDKLCFSLGMDHMKYVVTQNQTVAISGTVSSQASEKYQGLYNKDSVVLTDAFLRFEHTNGFNLLGFDAAFSQPLFRILKQKINVSFNGGIGLGALIPKTEVYVFENGMDNRFHLAGYAATVLIGPRINFLKRFFLSAELKGGYANLPSVLIKGDLPFKANHSLWFIEYYFVGGVYVPIKK